MNKNSKSPSSVTRASLMGLIILTLSISAFSQNPATSTLTWTANQSIDMQNNDSIAYSAQFKTYGSDSMVWIQKNGQRKSKYVIESVSGSWSNVSNNGSIVFTISRNNREAELTLERNSGGIFITMEFTGETPFRQKFRIESIESTP